MGKNTQGTENVCVRATKGTFVDLVIGEDHAQDKPEATPGRPAQPAESQNKWQRNKTPYNHVKNSGYKGYIVEKRVECCWVC